MHTFAGLGGGSSTRVGQVGDAAGRLRWVQHRHTCLGELVGEAERYRAARHGAGLARFDAQLVDDVHEGQARAKGLQRGGPGMVSVRQTATIVHQGRATRHARAAHAPRGGTRAPVGHPTPTAAARSPPTAGCWVATPAERPRHKHWVSPASVSRHARTRCGETLPPSRWPRWLRTTAVATLAAMSVRASTRVDTSGCGWASGASVGLTRRLNSSARDRRAVPRQHTTAPMRDASRVDLRACSCACTEAKLGPPDVAHTP